MSAFATYQDLEARLGIVMDIDEQTRATALLTAASDLVRDSAKQEISLATNDVVTLFGTFADEIVLPQRPVVSVSGIELSWAGGGPIAVDPLSYTLEGDILRRYAGYEGTGWFGPDYTLKVTYTHGYSTIPQIAKSITLESAARAWNNPEAASMSAIAGTQFQFPAVGMLLTQDEHDRLTRAFRRSGNRSIQLR